MLNILTRYLILAFTVALIAVTPIIHSHACSIAAGHGKCIRTKAKLFCT